MGGDESHLNEIHKALESEDGNFPSICVCREADWQDDVASIEHFLKQFIWEVPTANGFIFSRSAEHIVESWLHDAAIRDVHEWLPVKSVSTPHSRRIRKAFRDFDRLSQDCWYLPHRRSFFWVRSLMGC